ncbi:uncharacterized protein IL334_004351 [Kwoniella shivajii]|uniref:Palmitoyltransferase n=1 Tax=Kwoniella shivajii TaxID=564305 RepID=A0ABZ1D0H5_9TREE|nr:hypothetical protein IL334_004351 [Kwoniella shivajii]
MGRDWGRLWVGGTSLLISFISFSSQIFVVWPWYGRALSVDLLKLLVPFNFCVFMVFWNYRLCVITPPGGVPHGWRPNLSAMEGVEVKKGNHAPRYCKTCEHYKPPRAHHCRQCKTCILKLDHIATSFHLIMMAKRVLFMSYVYYEEPTLCDVLFLVFNFAACAPVWLCVCMFSAYHVYLACGNSTTIEGWEKDKVATLVRRGKIKEIKYPYSIGLIQNVKSVLGPNPLLWLWPQPMRGDGLSFPVNPEAGDSDVQYSWPPQDPTRLPNPHPLPDGTSPFVYGNEGFNPNLRPSNSAIRSRSSRTPSDHNHNYDANHNDQYGNDGNGDEVYSSGEDRDYGSDLSDSRSRSSSPEIYLSDYDDHNEGPLPSGERLPRVRRGSEGWEVRPGPATWAGGDDVEHGSRRPWEDQGRYHYYVPGE